MKINWFTIIAQIINFIILVWLLKKLLYKPVLNAISNREKERESLLNSAELKMAEAKQMQSDLQKKNEDLEKQKEELLKKIEEEVEEEKKRRLMEVYKMSDQLKDHLTKSIKEEKEQYIDELVNRVESEVFSLSKKVLKDLSSLNLQEVVTQIFIERLKNIDGKKRENLTGDTGTKVQKAVVKSAFEINSSLKEQIGAIIKKIADINEIQYEVDPDLICGIELIINGYRVAWSIKDYLNSMNTLLNGK
jgi:F-type H+-transporting ATPase subunit b